MTATIAETILGRDILTTRVADRGMDVTTVVRSEQGLCRTVRPWTAVWQQPTTDLVYLRFYDCPTTPGGLAEAHEHVVQQVRDGRLPRDMSTTQG